MRLRFPILLIVLLLSSQAFAQAGETGAAKQAVQLQQETPADTRIADFFEKLKASPKDPQAHVELGEVYLERGLYELALNSFRQALEFNPQFAPAHVGLSKLFRKKKMPALELSELEAAVAAAPENPTLLLQLGNLYMEPTHFDYGKAKKQFQMLKKLQSPLAAELGAKMGLQ